MVDKIFGADFTNESNPLSTYTLSVNTGSVLVDVTLADLLRLVTSKFKNVLVNGDMRVSQRGTSFTGITTGTNTIDRWRANISTLGTWTVTQESDAPTASVLSKSAKLLVTTADASPAAADLAIFRQMLEGQSLQIFKKGTASALGFALSFWVKSSTTGTFVVELLDTDNTRHCSASYTISSANAWEYKTVVFPADSSGALTDDVNASLQVGFVLAAGSNYTSGTIQTTWANTTDANRAPSQTNLAAAINNYIQFTGVQLEASAVSEFEYLPFDVQLSRCLRYYQKTFPYATVPAQNAGFVGAARTIAGKAGAASEFLEWRLSVKMRATPTVTTFNPAATNAQIRDGTGAVDCSATANSGVLSEDVVSLNCTGNAATAVGNSLSVHITAEAEI